MMGQIVISITLSASAFPNNPVLLPAARTSLCYSYSLCVVPFVYHRHENIKFAHKSEEAEVHICASKFNLEIPAGHRAGLLPVRLNSSDGP